MCVKNNTVVMDYHNADSEEFKSRPSWKQTFVDIANIVSKRSKDPHTKVGAVLVKNNCVIGVGYNGEPRNFNYSFDWSTNEKYKYVIHAEMNAIVNACSLGIDVTNSEIYLTMSPCHECMKLLIQYKIQSIYYVTEYKDIELSKFMADMSGIKMIHI